ncbi:DUF6233 domain-containing protein [Streptomyces sp. CB00455]|uniref:DUF6233 domain-containing protein n=1 Tax=Streptomyces sp. CB00455 TaxID=1703927 RepID=UPI003FD58F13
MHAGDCWDTGNRCAPADPEQIRCLLAEGVPACIPLPNPVSRPRRPSLPQTGERPPRPHPGAAV